MPESLGSAVLELFTDNSAFDKGLGTAKKGAEGLGASFAKTGAALTASVTAPIVGFGLALGDAATDFQEMNQSIAVGTGATGAALDGLQDSARNVFASLPESAETVGNVLANLNTGLGITGGSLEALSIQTANASRLLGEEAAPNAQAFTQALNQFGVPATEAGKNLDFLFATSQSFGTSLGSLLTSTKDYGAVLKNAGFSMAESADLFGRLDKAGISVSRVMPGLNAAFRKMAEAGEEPQAALQGIVEAIKNAETPMDALAIATEKFGAEGAQRLSVAIREGAFELAGLGAGLESVGGLINDTAASNQTFEESMGKLKNQVTTLLEPLGTQLVTSLQDVVAEITPFVTQAAEAVKVSGSVQPGLGAFAKHGSLELREYPDHLHHHPACRSGCVDRLSQATESRSGFLELLHDCEHVPKRARKSIQLPNHDHVILAKLIEEPLQLGTVPTSAGGLLAKDAFAASSFQRGCLSSGVLVVSRDSGVTDQHCTKVSPFDLLMQYLFATQEPLKTQQASTRCKTARLRNA